jgi:transitional endoplasmic reticulum ATPase
MIKKDNTESYLRLKVSEAVQDDVGKGIVRVDTNNMKKIGVRPGDFVSIKGEKETVAIVDRSYPSDIGLDLIRMDGLTRWNAKTSVGERVSIKKTDAKPAKTMVIAPAQKGVFVQVQPEMIKRSLLGRVVVKGDVMSLGGTRRRRTIMGESPFSDIFRLFEEDNLLPFGFSEMRFMIVDSNPKGATIVSEDTKISLKSEAVEFREDKIPEVTYEDIGGLDEPIRKIREMVELPMKKPEIFERLGIDPPKGVLLYGPPGTGKTLLAKAVANETDAHFILLNGPEVMSKWVGEAEKKIREVFDDAEKNAPSIIFIDEIDAIAPKREDVIGEVERRVVAQILASMDGMKGRGKVVVIAATNRQNALDPALRRPGRFDREIEIGIPDKKSRLEILKIHTRGMPLKQDVDLEKMADVTHGFVGADLAALSREAAMNVLRKLIDQEKLELYNDKPLSKETLEKMRVGIEDFRDALKNVQPSTMREVLIEVPKVKWNDVGGLQEVKESLREAIEWPMKYPDSFVGLGIEPPKGILLYGPPGTGKTMLAKAVATESEANFISVKGPEIFSKWVGESEKAIREIFRKARQVAPCIIFFDELDAITPRRGLEEGARVSEKVVNQILTEMDGIESLSDVVVIAATNRPDIIDPGLLRPGRIDRMILVPSPDDAARHQIFLVHTKNMPIDKAVNLEKLARSTEGYSGADIQAICREAAMNAMRRQLENVRKIEWKISEESGKDTKESKKRTKELEEKLEKLREKEIHQKVTAEDFKEALERVKPSISKEEIKFYEEFDKRLSQVPTEEHSYVG